MQKNIKYELLGTGQNIPVAIVYEQESTLEVRSVFLITKELLDQEKISVKKMVRYLKGDLKQSDKDYLLCQEIYFYNNPIEKKQKTNSKQSQHYVSRIISAYEEWTRS